jgi:hypothetical protein
VCQFKFVVVGEGLVRHNSPKVIKLASLHTHTKKLVPTDASAEELNIRVGLTD